MEIAIPAIEPTSFQDTQSSEDSKQWIAAIEVEL
jgi:hypothetical protein